MKFGAIGVACIAVALSGCSIVAPTYQPSFQNIQKLKDGGTNPVKIGTFIPGNQNKDDVNKITLRASPLVSPYKGSYAEYLHEAILQEMYGAGRLSDKTKVEVSGVLLQNDLDASGISIGTASIKAQFVVKKDAEVRFDKVVSTNHQWDSSFVGAIAIPAAMQNYSVLVQNLLGKLYSDSDFINALK